MASSLVCSGRRQTGWKMPLSCQICTPASTRLLYMRGGEVLAWDVPRPVEARLIDWERYHELAVRAASAVFWPMGIPEDDLRAWLKGGIQLKFDFALPDGKRHFLLPRVRKKAPGIRSSSRR